MESNHIIYRGWCDICIKARVVDTPHRVNQQDEQARKDADKDSPRIYPDYLYMSPDEKSTPHVAFKLSRSGRLAATALPAKGATEFGVKLFALQTQSIGARSFINHSDGENAVKVLKEAAARMVPGIEAKPQECPVGGHQANGFNRSGSKRTETSNRSN